MGHYLLQICRWQGKAKGPRLEIAIREQYLYDDIVVSGYSACKSATAYTDHGDCVAEGIREVTGLETKIKWPNDIVVNGKKICGILTEMSTEIDYINHVVIGVGINVNQDTFPDDIKETASSLKMELGKRIKRSGLIAAVMKIFEKYYEIFQETEDLSGLQELYNSMLVNKDREVKVLEPGNEYKAYAIGINQTGELIVRTPDGKEKEIYAGEVSVRGVYGYV